jgi:hypothetical protein
MKILITGATGLVGKTLIKKLLSKGHEINYLTTRKEALTSISGCNGFLWDVKNQFIDKNCINNVNTIIHLAGANVSKRWTPNYKKEILSSRINSSQLLYSLLKEKKHNVTQFVSASAIGIYKDSLTNLYTEESLDFSNSFLGEVVRKWEDSVEVMSTLDIKITKIRIGVVLAKNGGALQKIVHPISLGIGAPLGSGKQIMSWIHIDDLCELVSFVISKNLSGVFNAVAPKPVSNNVITKEIASCLKKPLWLPSVPQFVLKIILGEMHKIVLESQNVSSKKVEKIGFEFKYKNVNEALKELL